MKAIYQKWNKDLKLKKYTMKQKAVWEFFLKGSFIRKAKRYFKESTSIKELITKAFDYVENHDALSEVVNKVKLFGLYIMDVVQKKYKGYSKRSVILCLAGLIYLITPIDFIPDFIPIMGLFDDAVVIGYIFTQLHEELMKYSKFKGINYLSNIEDVDFEDIDGVLEDKEL